MARAQRQTPQGIETGDELVARLYDDGVAAIGPPMHQSVPHVLVTGEGDAGLMFLELAVGITLTTEVALELLQ